MKLMDKIRLAIFPLAILIMGSSFIMAQDASSFKKEEFYMDSGQRLLIEVHVWGEVNSPGMYRVPDGSTVLDLMSRAGGPTQYAALSRVRLSSNDGTKRLNQKINIDKYLNSTKDVDIPVLKPGDTVMIPRNARFFWKDAIGFIADLAVIANVYYLISRNR
ncbi:MAG: SLBB domain-containing protein [Candidatus Edwardsbacteria bacterium]|nr:SLBB domain-containing protein [Candidatus Edwardsbacteria bacterium]MBU1576165.1 SLBB domain-containing protein [Candidatus Edwardsbacteria bacterium]MBU2463591.1 SLBB domain-containing protein [Candidatus Edwardsbacteria bacterium]MBU2593205.1 SLBB domain-containing protein [Candidatus Edwardsbacteria bacterium]